MNKFKLCEDICKLHDSFQGAGFVQQGLLVAMYSKPATPIPEDSKFQRMFIQTEIIAGITKTNADFFGNPRFFSLYFENCDLYFFPLWKYGHENILVVQVIQPYVHEDVISKIMAYLDQRLAASD